MIHGNKKPHLNPSDKAHQRLDYEGIHEKICQLLVPLRTPVAVLGSEEERAAREKETRQRQWKLLEISKTEAHKKLFEAKVCIPVPTHRRCFFIVCLRWALDSERHTPKSPSPDTPWNTAV